MSNNWEELNNARLELGDVVSVRGTARISQMIRWFSRAKGEPKTWANHSGMVCYVSGNDVFIIEALSRVKQNSLFHYNDGKSQVVVTRMIGLNEEQRRELASKASSYIGQKYGWWKIIAHSADRAIGNRYFFRRMLFANKYPICSWVVSHAYSKVLGYWFGIHPDAAQPDDILDNCLKPTTPWEVVWTSDSDINLGRP